MSGSYAPKPGRLQVRRDLDRNTTLVCCICGNEEEVYHQTKSEFLQELYQAGWRYVSNEVFALIGAVCPTCLANPEHGPFKRAS